MHTVQEFSVLILPGVKTVGKHARASRMYKSMAGCQMPWLHTCTCTSEWLVSICLCMLLSTQMCSYRSTAVASDSLSLIYTDCWMWLYANLACDSCRNAWNSSLCAQTCPCAWALKEELNKNSLFPMSFALHCVGYSNDMRSEGGRSQEVNIFQQTLRDQCFWQQER